MVNKPILQGTHNTRELGGYPLKDGGQTKRDRFLRSDSLCGLTLEDRQILKEKGLSLVIDLRSEFEQEQAPDQMCIRDSHKSGYLVRAGDNKKFADILKKAMNLNIDEYNAMSRYA